MEITEKQRRGPHQRGAAGAENQLKAECSDLYVFDAEFSYRAMDERKLGVYNRGWMLRAR